MSHNSTEQFYAELPEFKGKIIDLLSEESQFQPVPSDWVVVVTDIKKSTIAIQKGLYQAINLIATACIVSALNIANEYDVNFPFFFGGDGSTLIIPPCIKEDVIKALSVHQSNVKRNYNLELRVDEILVSEIYKQRKTISIAKVKINDLFSIPVVLGEGLIYADDYFKTIQFKFREIDTASNALNLNGMECRWDAVKPPENTFEVVCLLVKANKPEDQAKVYKLVLENIEQIYGSFEARSPISAEKLNLLASIPRFKIENQVKHSSSGISKIGKSIIDYIVGKIYVTFRKSGKDYVENIAELIDILIVDGRINTVISGTKANRLKLETKLDGLEASGVLQYGLAVCKESIMSCYVQDRKHNHIHFVDGSEGGYTRAASKIKMKIASAAKAQN